MQSCLHESTGPKIKECLDKVLMKDYDKRIVDVCRSEDCRREQGVRFGASVWECGGPGRARRTCRTRDGLLCCCGLQDAARLLCVCCRSPCAAVRSRVRVRCAAEGGGRLGHGAWGLVSLGSGCHCTLPLALFVLSYCSPGLQPWVALVQATSLSPAAACVEMVRSRFCTPLTWCSGKGRQPLNFREADAENMFWNSELRAMKTAEAGAVGADCGEANPTHCAPLRFCGARARRPGGFRALQPQPERRNGKRNSPTSHRRFGFQTTYLPS